MHKDRAKLSKFRFLRKVFYTKLIKSLLKEAKIVLDVGCGRGEFVETCSRWKKFCIGLDIQLTFPSIDYNSVYVEYVQADMFHLPFRSNAVDVIIFSRVIEHISVSEAISFLRSFNRLSNTIIVITPSYHRAFWSPGHVTPYTLKTIRRVLELANYKPMIITYDKAFILNIPLKFFPELIVKFLNLTPVARLKVNILAVGKRN